jgi:hypothetical protein
VRAPFENRESASDFDSGLAPVTPEAASSSPVDPTKSFLLVICIAGAAVVERLVPPGGRRFEVRRCTAVRSARSTTECRVPDYAASPNILASWGTVLLLVYEPKGIDQSH